jgi:hypothetical protein
MKPAKQLRLILNDIVISLRRQTAAAERSNELYWEVIDLQKQQLSLSKKNVKTSQLMANIAHRQYRDRLLATTLAKPPGPAKEQPLTDVDRRDLESLIASLHALAAYQHQDVSIATDATHWLQLLLDNHE